MDVIANYGGHKAYDYGGHPAPSGRALPNLINAVRMLKSKSTCLSRRQPKLHRIGFRRDKQVGVDVDVDFKILTAFIRLGRARPEGAGCPP